MKPGYPEFLTIFLLTLFFFAPDSVFSDPTDGFLGDDLNFEEIYADIPHNFNLETSTMSEFDSLPYFTHESSRKVVGFRNSLKTGNTLRANLDNIPGLSPVQRAILDHISQLKESQSLPGFSSSF